MRFRKLDSTLHPYGIEAGGLLAGVPRGVRREVADALVAIAESDDPDSAFVGELGRAALAESAVLPWLRKAGASLTASLERPTPSGTLVEREFLISLAFVPPEIWPEARSNPGQRAEWNELFGSDDAHPDWPVDTRYLSSESRRRIAECATDDVPGGMAIHGENLAALSALDGGRFRCLYIDPPYNTRSSRFQYADSMKEGLWLGGLSRRLRAAKRLLADDGVAWVQVDHNASDGLGAMLRRTFAGGVQNRVVWAYGGSGRGAKAISGRLPRNYDTLFVSAMDARRFRLNRVTVPFEVPKEDAGRFGFRFDGRRWFKTAPRGDYTDDSVSRLDDAGRIHRTRNGSVRVKYFLREADGMVIEDRLIGDVWTDIPDMMHAPRDEWTGFASQKPLALLRRVLDLSCRSGDWVLDFYAGTGTTAVAALQRGLRFVVIESGPQFDAVLLPRLKRALAANAGIVKVMSVRSEA